MAFRNLSAASFCSADVILRLLRVPVVRINYDELCRIRPVRQLSLRADGAFASAKTTAFCFPSRPAGVNMRPESDFVVKGDWTDVQRREPAGNESLRVDARCDAALIDDANGCVVTWTRRDGHPAAAYVTHVVVDGEIYITSRERRAKNARCAAIHARRWCSRFRAAVASRPRPRRIQRRSRLRRRIMNAMADRAKYQGAARETFIRNLDSPGRVVIRIVPEKYASRNERTAPAAYGSAQGMPSNYR